MRRQSTIRAPEAAGSRTVQEYIDERPSWPDGTVTARAPMTSMQWRIWALASAGKFFEGLVVFMTGIALPLISAEFRLTPTDAGLVTAASLAGILVGASALGGLADAVGRKRMFIVEMIIFLVFSVALTFAPNFLVVVLFLFGTGLALGCDYPTAHMIISESIPTSVRGRLVLSAFAFQAVGALFGTVVGFIVLYENPHVGAWRWMYATLIPLAILVMAGRFFLTDSPHGCVRAVSPMPSGRFIGCSGVTRRTPRTSRCIGWRRARGIRMAVAVTARFSPPRIAKRPCWRRFPGPCRTSAPMASVSSPRRSWRR